MAPALKNMTPSRTTVLRIPALDCPEEVALIEKTLQPLEGVAEITANMISGKATIRHTDEITSRTLISHLEKAGLESLLEGEKEKKEGAEEHSFERHMVTLAGTLLALGFVLKWSGIAPFPLTYLCFALSILSGSVLIIPGALLAARRLSPDINLLMTIAVGGAVVIGEWDEGAAVFFLFSLSELLESLSVAKTRREIRALLDLSPQTALLEKGGEIVEVAVEEVKVGDRVFVKSGARLPLDGKVASGRSTVNEAPITGESMPVEKEPGALVFAGSINGAGSFEFTVTKAFQDTTLARIVHLIEEAQSQKAESQRFVDVFSKYYTPAVIVLSLLIFLFPPLFLGGLWGDWFYRALVLLVISCPCALVISTPIAVVSGLTALARRGVLVKGGLFLELIAKLRVLAIDKTGTLTQGKPTVNAVHPFDGYGEKDVLRLAASLDVHSDHPFAQAVVARAGRENLPLSKCESFNATAGQGVEGRMDGHSFFAGNHRMTHNLGVCTPELEGLLETIESKGQSVVVLGHTPHADCAGEVLGVIAVGDRVREESSEAIRKLKAVGIEEVVLLSGDNETTAAAIASQTGITDVRANLLPEDKVNAVQALLSKFEFVAMVGDGINDAPAMAAAGLGIAMGAAGADAAIETADVALMKDDLRKIADAVIISRRTQAIIRFNIGFAIGIKALFIALTLIGYASLWLAIAADMGASLLVIGNSLRLLNRKIGETG